MRYASYRVALEREIATDNPEPANTEVNRICPNRYFLTTNQSFGPEFVQDPVGESFGCLSLTSQAPECRNVPPGQ